MNRDGLWHVVETVIGMEPDPAAATATIRELLTRANRWDWLAEALDATLGEIDPGSLVDLVLDMDAKEADELLKFASTGLAGLVRSVTALPTAGSDGYRWEVEIAEKPVAVFSERSDAEEWAGARTGYTTLRRVGPPIEESE